MPDDKQAPPEPCSLLESYKGARGQIEHENTLIGHRITWFLTFQGLLLTAFFVALGLLDGNKAYPPWQRGLVGVGALLICCLGFASALICAKLIGLAYGQVERVTDWWLKRAGDHRRQYPPLYGLADPGARAASPQPAAGAEKFLVVIGFIWTLLALIAASMAWLALIGP